MNQDKKNVFLSHDHLWCSQTKRINHENQVAVLCTHTGFFTRSGAKKDYKETTRLFQKELAALKDSSHCPFLLSEYLDYWFHKIYLPACTCKNTAVRYRWIIENVILPNMETDPLIQTVDTGYMEDLIRSFHLGVIDGDAGYDYSTSAYHPYALLLSTFHHKQRKNSQV